MLLPRELCQPPSPAFLASQNAAQAPVRYPSTAPQAPEARRQLVFDEPAAPPSELTLTCGTALPSPDVAACQSDEMEYQQHQQHCSQSVLTAQQEALEVASPSTPPAQCGSIPRRRASPSVPGTLPGSLETSLLYALQVCLTTRPATYPLHCACATLECRRLPGFGAVHGRRSNTRPPLPLQLLARAGTPYMLLRSCFVP